MNVLFIGSGNRSSGLSPIVASQKESLIREGLRADSYAVMGKGAVGYLRNISRLRAEMTRYRYDLFHAHYSLSGFVATFAGCRPLVVSLMGSDTKLGFITKATTQFLNAMFWSRCIVKSSRMTLDSGLRNAVVIPNGVDLQLFSPSPKGESQRRLGFSRAKRHILFGSDPDRPEKNYFLAASAIGMIQAFDVEIHYLRQIPHDRVPYYLCASDLLLLTSKREGSPSVIKEAMACNCPVVATYVGDVAWLFGDEPGHFLTSFDPQDVADKIQAALDFSTKNGRTKGRERLVALGLDSKTVAERLIGVYESVIESKR